MNNKTLAFFVFFAFLACRQSADIKKIKADVAHPASFELSNVIDQVEFIVLGNGIADSTVQYNNINRLYFTSGKYYVLDRDIGDYQDVFVKVFDKTGAYRTKYYVGAYGISPFKAIKDMWTNGEIIQLLDYGRAGIWTARLTGEDLRWTLQELGEGFDKFFRVSENVVVVDADNSPTASLNLFTLGTFDQSNGQSILLDTAVVIPDYFSGVGLVESRFFADLSDNKIYYIPPSGTDVYRVEESGMINHFLTFRMGASSFDPIAQAGISQERFLDLRSRQQWIMGFDKAVVWNDLLLLQYRFENEFYWLLSDLNTGKTASIKPSFEFVDYFQTSYSPQYVDENGLVHFKIQKRELYDYISTQPNSGLAQKIRTIEQLDPEEGVAILRFPLDLLRAFLMD